MTAGLGAGAGGGGGMLFIGGVAGGDGGAAVLVGITFVVLEVLIVRSVQCSVTPPPRSRRPDRIYGESKVSRCRRQCTMSEPTGSSW